MIHLHATDISMRFFDHWVLKKVNVTLPDGEKLLITGRNGSGKSTLLRILAGQLTPTKGKLVLSVGKRVLEPTEYYRHLSWMGPYFDLYTDLTLDEAIRMHFSLKKCRIDSQKKVVEALNLKGHQSKLLRDFSSGMLHRLKIGLATLTDTPLLFLDEPTANMDEENSAYILKLIDEHSKGRSLIFASNEPSEFSLFENRLDLSWFSP